MGEGEGEGGVLCSLRRSRSKVSRVPSPPHAIPLTVYLPTRAHHCPPSMSNYFSIALHPHFVNHLEGNKIDYCSGNATTTNRSRIPPYAVLLSWINFAHITDRCDAQHVMAIGGQRAVGRDERDEEVLRADTRPQRATSENFLGGASRQSRVMELVPC